MVIKQVLQWSPGLARLLFRAAETIDVLPRYTLFQGDGWVVELRTSWSEDE